MLNKLKNKLFINIRVILHIFIDVLIRLKFKNWVEGKLNKDGHCNVIFCLCTMCTVILYRGFSLKQK